MTKILILGGGFGGVRCALDLSKKLKSEILAEKIEITLVDRNGYHLFVPALYEVASAYGLKRDAFAVQLRRTVCMPYADIFQGKHVNFIQAEITEISLEEKPNAWVKTGGNHVLEYDYLVLALGGEAADYNITGVKEYAHQFKTLEDSLFTNEVLEDVSEQFKKGQRTDPFNFLICGGGFTGIELAAELACCSKVIKEKCKLRGRCSSISVFEAGPKILPAISEKERGLIKKRLTQLGIILMENSPIEEVGADFIKLKSGQQVRGDMVIWTAGIQPMKLLKLTPNLPLGVTGRIKVNNFLQVGEFKNIYATGDVTEFTDPKTQKPVPAFAYISSRQSRVVANNIYNSLKNKNLKTYKPAYDLWILPVGGKYALAHLRGKFIVKGLWGWIIRELVDLKYLLSIFSLNKALEVFFNDITIFSKND